MLPAATSSTEFAEAVIETLQDADRLASLRIGCRDAADLYTIDAMVDRFRTGVLKALEG